MSHKKVAVIGTPEDCVIGARALLNRIMHERENPPLLIVPNLRDLDAETISGMIKEMDMHPAPIVAGIIYKKDD